MQSTDAEAAVMSGGRSIAVAQFEAAQGRRARWILVLRLLVGIAFLAFWEFASGRLIDKLFISSASSVFGRLSKWVMDGTLVNHLSITLYATMWGFLIGSFVGFALGLLFGRFRALAEVLDPYITRHVGAAYLPEAAAIGAQKALAQQRRLHLSVIAARRRAGHRLAFQRRDEAGRAPLHRDGRSGRRADHRLRCLCLGALARRARQDLAGAA